MSADKPNLDTVVLEKGSHTDRRKGVCLMELAAWVAGKPHTDRPPCVSPVIGAFGRRYNDAIADEPRQDLKQFIPPMLNTAGDGLDEKRAFMSLDFAIRTVTPIWLEAAGLTKEAILLRGLAEIVDRATARSATAEARVVRSAAWAERDRKFAELRSKFPAADAAYAADAAPAGARRGRRRPRPGAPRRARGRQRPPWRTTEEAIAYTRLPAGTFRKLVAAAASRTTAAARTSSTWPSSTRRSGTLAQLQGRD
jgi:hypothetical protein